MQLLPSTEVADNYRTIWRLKSRDCSRLTPRSRLYTEFGLTSRSLKAVDLRVFADEELGRELGVVPGVAAADVSGGVVEEVRVNIDLERLQAVGVGLTTVLDELEARNQDISGGRILGESEPLTRTVGRFQEADEIGKPLV
jgi:multidrug efflux pump subunit AcrB